MGGYYLPATITSFTKGNMMIALVAAAVVIVLALIFSKFIEMAATSALGGWCTALCAIELLGKAGVTLEGKTLTIVKLAIIGVFFIAGTIVQFKTRKRY